jgi:hypothetical protein
MGATLDRKRPYGTVSGGDCEGRAFEQDNAFFFADGSAWHPTKPEQDLVCAPVAASAKPAVKKGKPEPETPALDAQLDAQLGAA